MPETVLNALSILSLSVLTTIPWYKYSYYCAHFLHENTEAREIKQHTAWKWGKRLEGRWPGSMGLDSEPLCYTDSLSMFTVEFPATFKPHVLMDDTFLPPLRWGLPLPCLVSSDVRWWSLASPCSSHCHHFSVSPLIWAPAHAVSDSFKALSHSSSDDWSLPVLLVCVASSAASSPTIFTN